MELCSLKLGMLYRGCTHGVKSLHLLSALFIQPRYAKLLNKKMIEQAMGERNQVSAFVPHPHRNPEPTPPEPPAVVSVAP